jgi:hypothetical protein
MKTRHSRINSIAAAGLIGASGLVAGAAAAQTPSLEELWARVQQQQAEIEALKAELGNSEDRAEQTDARLTEAETQLAANEEELSATVDYVETMADTGARDTTIGGYGELHYNNLSSDAGGDTDQIDYHRFVLFFGHRFNERIQFFSELELEHSLAADGAPGEIELEQAYLDFVLNENLSAKAGLFLVPVGILNETHEPPTFYGVERNDVENIIIPSTWWEAGTGLNGRLGSGLSWDFAVHSGLAMPTTGGSAFRVRSGRQKVAEALASDFAYTGRLRYTGIPGLDLSASLQYQSDPSQVAADGLDSGVLFTAHAIWQRNDFRLRALYGGWSFDGDAVELAGVNEQSGWYVEPSYRLNPDWGIYARYEDLDGARVADQFSQWEVGLNYWPVPNVVLKFDYRDRDFDQPSMAGFDGFDLGVGYQF